MLKLKNWSNKHPMYPTHRLLAEQFSCVDPLACPWSFEGLWKRNASWGLNVDTVNEMKKFQKPFLDGEKWTNDDVQTFAWKKS